MTSPIDVGAEQDKRKCTRKRTVLQREEVVMEKILEGTIMKQNPDLGLERQIFTDRRIPEPDLEATPPDRNDTDRKGSAQVSHLGYLLTLLCLASVRKS